jgi:hypothetical protein
MMRSTVRWRFVLQIVKYELAAATQAKRRQQ